MRKKPSQSIIEYLVLFCVICAALLIGQNFIKRRYQGYIKQNMEGISQVFYSPGASTRLVISKTNQNTTSETKNGITVTNTRAKTNLSNQERVDALSLEKFIK